MLTKSFHSGNNFESMLRSTNNRATSLETSHDLLYSSSFIMPNTTRERSDSKLEIPSQNESILFSNLPKQQD